MPNSLSTSSSSKREPDCSFKSLVRSGAVLTNFILQEIEKERLEQLALEPKKSRYAEYIIKPVSGVERQKIILAQQWVTSVKDTCSRILGVDNRHQ